MNKLKFPKPKKKKSLKKQCDELWAEVVKKRAGYKSEYSGKEGKQIGGESILNAHHLRGKSSYRLRYDLKNGYCCTNGEHNFGFHHTGRRADYERVVEFQRPGIWEYLEMIKNQKCDSLKLIKIYLEQQLEKDL